MVRLVKMVRSREKELIFIKMEKFMRDSLAII